MNDRKSCITMRHKTETLKRLANVPVGQAVRELEEQGRKVVSIERKGRYLLAKVAMEDMPVVDVPPAADPGPELGDMGPDSDEPMDHVEDEMGELGEIRSLLEQIADAVGVSTTDDLEGDGDLVISDDDLDVPEPVEEPVDDGIFASKISGKRHFTATRKAEAGLTDGQIVREAGAVFPKHEVTIIDRQKKASEGIILIGLRHTGE